MERKEIRSYYVGLSLFCEQCVVIITVYEVPYQEVTAVLGMSKAHILPVHAYQPITKLNDNPPLPPFTFFLLYYVRVQDLVAPLISNEQRLCYWLLREREYRVPLRLFHRSDPVLSEHGS